MPGDRERALGALEGKGRIYAVLDGARDPRVARLAAGGDAPSWCLYRGKLPQALKEAAPHLLHLRPGHDYADIFFRVGWRNAWGILLATPAKQEDLYRHLRRFLRVRAEDGKLLVFRYYDPRILRQYLPSCTPAEMERFFGPISVFAAEAEEPQQFHLFRRAENGFEQVLGGNVVKRWPAAEPAPLRGPAVLRREQLQALADPIVREYEDGIVAWVADEFPAQFELREEAGIRALVRGAVARAPGYGLTRSADVTGLLSLMLLLGDDFADRQEHAWIRDILGSASVPSAEKVRRVLAQLAADSRPEL